MYLPDITGALLGTFLQHVGSSLRHVQPPHLVGVVSPRHRAGRGALRPWSCLFKVIIHELIQYFWMLWLTGWWWEDLVSNKVDCEIFCYLCQAQKSCLFSCSRSRQWVDQCCRTGMYCGGSSCYSMQMWSIMGRTRSSSMCSLVSVDLFSFVTHE